MASRKITKIYFASWNKRENGKVKNVRKQVVKKRNKYYTMEGEEIPSWATITIEIWKQTNS